MDYFRHMHTKLRGGRLAGDVVEWDRNIGDTARILRNEKGEAAGFVVEAQRCADASLYHGDCINTAGVDCYSSDCCLRPR